MSNWRSAASLLGSPDRSTATSINGHGATIPKGTPVQRKPGRSALPEVVPVSGIELMSEFAGIMDEALRDDPNGDQAHTRLVTSGVVRAAVYVATASECVVGRHLLPVVLNGKAVLLAQSVFNTGIILVEDLTATPNGTLLDPSTGPGALVYLVPGTVDESRPRPTFSSPDTASATYYKSANASSASVATVITSFSNDGTPDHARNVVITTGGTTADVAAGNILVEGTDLTGAVISENIPVTENQNGASTGNLAFATVTRVTIPVQDGAAATFSVGTGVKLGLKRKFNAVPLVLAAYYDTTKESTLPTVAVSLTALAGNTISFNTAPNGSRSYLAYLQA